MKFQINSLASIALIVILFMACSDSKVEKFSIPDHGKFHRIAEMVEDEIEMTRDPATLEVPKNKLYKIRKNIIQSNANKEILADDDWESRGPIDVGGRTRAFLFDSRDSTNNTLFVGSVSGGLWKCTDALSFPSWERVETYLGNTSIGSIIQDPHNPEIMYIGTGEGWFNGDAYRGDGIYKSIDGGINWERLVNTNNEAFYYNQKLAITQDSVLLVATRNNGIIRSRNGGVDWSISLNNLNQGFSNRIADIEITPSGTIFASAGMFSTDGLYRSLDGGEQWEYIDLEIDSFERIEISVSKKDTNIVMLMVQDMNTNSVGHILVSQDNGDTWTSKDVPTRDNGTPMANGQAWYDMSSAIDPNDSDVMYVGGVDLYKTIDGGNSWRRVSNWFGGTSLPFVHADQHSVHYVGTDSETAIFSNDGGLWISKDANAIRPEFEDISFGYISTQYYACDIHPNEETDFYIGGSQDNGTELINMPGLSTSVGIGGGDGAFCHIDQLNPNIVVRSSQRGNYRISTEANFTNNNSFSVTGSAYFVNPSDYDDINKILFASSDAGEYEWFNVLTTERDSVQVPIAAFDRMSAFLVDPIDNNLLYVGTNDGRILRIQDPTSQEPEMTQLFHGPGFTRNIDVDSANPDRIICTYSNFGIQSIYFSENGGLNWRSLEGNLPDIPVRWGVFNPGNREEVIIATEVGIWSGSTAQSSVQWENISGSIGLGRVNMLRFRESDQQMLAASYGKGLFTTNQFAKAGLKFENSQISLAINGKIEADFCNPVALEMIRVNTSLPFDLDANLTISVAVESTAIEGEDFLIENKTAVIPAGELSYNIELQAFDNAVIDGDKTLILNIESDQEVLKGQTEILLQENDSEFNDGESSFAVAVGTGNTPTGDVFRGFYENNRSQVLYRADYLKENGLNKGEIKKLIFDIVEKRSEMPYNNFSLSMGLTNVDELLELDNSAQMTEVFSGTLEIFEGTNIIFMQESFNYDGVSNLLLDFCYDNDFYSSNDFIRSTAVNYQSLFSYFEDGVDGCLDSGPDDTEDLVPNIIFESFAISELLTNVSQTFQSSLKGEEVAYFQSSDSILCSIKGLDQNGSDNCFTTQLLSNGSQVIDATNSFWVQRILRVDANDSNAGDYELTYFMPIENSEEWKRPHIEALFTNDDLIDTAIPEWESIDIIETKETSGYISFTVPYQGNGAYTVGIADRTVNTQEIDKNVVYDGIKYFDILGRAVDINNDALDITSGIYIKSYFYKGKLVESEKILISNDY